MTYIPGKTIADSPVTTEDLYHVGKMIATIDKIIQQVSSQVKLTYVSSAKFWTR